MHELFSLKNKAVVITGSSRGIGKGMAKDLQNLEQN